jgi:hypothetical protein
VLLTATTETLNDEEVELFWGLRAEAQRRLGVPAWSA